MEFLHKPVLAMQAVNGLHIKADGIYADATVGGGGHASMICEELGDDALFIGIDRDREALREAEVQLEKYRCRKIFIHENFAEIKCILREFEIKNLDGVIMDLGVSSPQLDDPARGFSYKNDGPLDMRMDASTGPEETEELTAYRVINEYSKGELSRIFRTYGEERWSSRIAEFIVEARKEAPIKTTDELTKIIKAAIPASARREGPHPSKRVFQAIRIEVNAELDSLKTAVEDFIDSLGNHGRISVISFHSLEDRIVKETYRRRENPCTCPPDLPHCSCGLKPDLKRINRKPILPKPEETENNPRARSAKLRIAEKI